MKTLKCRENLGIVDYCNIVNQIAEGYFGDEGEYIPYIGRINQMCVFYNDCLEKDENEEDVTDILDMDTILSNEEFVSTYTSSLCADFTGRLTFSEAVKDAMDIVNTRKGSMGHLLEVIKGIADKLINSMSAIATPDIIEKFSVFTEEVSSGNLDIGKIVASIGKTQNKSPEA